jgi:FlgD Ig-like domain
LSIVDRGGDLVRRLANRQMAAGRQVFYWNGRRGNGTVPPDGTYYLRVALVDEGRATVVPRGVRVVTEGPRPKLLSVTPPRVPPTGPRRITIRYEGQDDPAALFSVYRTDTGKPKLVRRFVGDVGKQSGLWDGNDQDGKPVPPGTYAFAVTVQNRALVNGSAPPQLPPVPEAAAPETGVTVSGPQASGPLDPVRPGAAVPIELPGVQGDVRWRLGRVGEERPVARGRDGADGLRVEIPRRATTGVYVVRLATPSGRAAVPLVVNRPSSEARVLVVLPAISWQGHNPIDDDADGFPNTLADSVSVRTDRPFAFGRLPGAFGRETAPLLAFLGERDYALTTDLALARQRGPRLTGHSGVLFAGSALYLTEELDAELRSFVDAGGRLASFGTDAFRRTVDITATSIGDQSTPQRSNIFGEAVNSTSSEAAPLVVHSDGLGLFAGTDGFVGLFTRFEQQEALVDGAQSLTAAGREPEHPAFAGYKLGRGTVIRVGAPEWAKAIEEDTEVAAVTEAVWRLLSR